MNPIRTLPNIYGSIAYAIGPERWIPRLTPRVLCSVRTKEKKEVHGIPGLADRQRAHRGAASTPDTSVIQSW